MHCLNWFAVLPVFTGIFCCLGILICYAVAASNSQLPDFPWPYISDLGAQPSESCLFGFFMTWSGIGYAAVGVLNYKYVSLQFDSKLNNAGLFCSLLYSVGLTIVAAFQWTSLFWVHMVGAGSIFIGLPLHCWMIAIVTWRYLRCTENYSPAIVYVRLVFAALSSTFAFFFLIFFIVRMNSRLLLTLCTVSEWCAGLFGFVVVMSLAYDMRHITYINLLISSSRESVEQTAKNSSIVLENNNVNHTNVSACSTQVEMLEKTK